jgi:hypothetical protein
MPPAPEQVRPTPASSKTPVDAPTAGETAARRLRERAQSRFRVAHQALLGQGLSIGVLGGVALAWSMANLRFGAEGMPLIGLSVTPMHGGLLLADGVLAILACLGRWTTVAFSAAAAAGWAALAIVCAVAAAHHTPGVLGFDPRDTLLYGALGAYNLALCLWLAPTLWQMWRAVRDRGAARLGPS